MSQDARVPRAGGECHAVLADAEARDAVFVAIENADALALWEEQMRVSEGRAVRRSIEEK